jgi:hypothetical protein
MRDRINKPRVFLSHARKDVAFIERIETDLRKCQIEPWRDQNEIRDGESWQNVIFSEGLPTCDVVVTYYTENSLTSQMVMKEVDAALLHQLSDSGIGFLPYVNSDKNRNNLRLDIQSLHCRVWNDDNYYEVLPSVVAEIWRRYMERSVSIAVSQEKNRRLEAELKFERLKLELNTSPEQKLAELLSNSKLCFHIVNQRSGKSLDVADWNQNDGNRIQQWAYHAGHNQIWELKKVKDEYFSITSKHSRKCLTVIDASLEDNAIVVQSDYAGNNHQQWALIKVGDGSYRIIAKHSSFCLDVLSASCDNGASIIQAEQHSGNSQSWWLNINATSI